MDAKITLRAISGSASGRKMKIFCVPEDTDKFRDFLQSAGLRARERNAYSITGEYQVNGVMKVISKLALAPVNIRAFDAMSISGKEAGGFVLSHDKT